MNEAVNKTILANGTRILTQHIPHAHSVSMGVWVDVGARDEALPESGLSHFIEHMIFKGTRKRSAFQIAKEFDAVGGHTNAFTAMENTCYYAKVMDTHTDTMVDILSDIFLNSVFDPAEIERERPVILQEIGMVEDSPDEYVHVLSGNTFWGDNPLGRSILGPPENIRLFDADTLRDFFRRFYQPERIVIAAAGNIDHTYLVDRVAPAFDAIQNGAAFPPRITPEGCSRVGVHYRKLEQAHICLGARGLSVTDPRRFTFSLMNTILGGNMSSRLFQEIRERRGLAYAVYSFISSHVDTGMFGVYVAVDPARIHETLRLILTEVRKLKELPVEPAELSDAKEFTKGCLLLASESSDNQMVRLAQNEMHFGRDVPMEEVLKQIDAVRAEDITDLAAHLLGPNQLALTLLGPVEPSPVLEDILYL